MSERFTVETRFIDCEDRGVFHPHQHRRQYLVDKVTGLDLDCDDYPTIDGSVAAALLNFFDACLEKGTQ